MRPRAIFTAPSVSPRGVTSFARVNQNSPDNSDDLLIAASYNYSYLYSVLAINVLAPRGISPCYGPNPTPTSIYFIPLPRKKCFYLVSKICRFAIIKNCLNSNFFGVTSNALFYQNLLVFFCQASWRFRCLVYSNLICGYSSRLVMAGCALVSASALICFLAISFGVCFSRM